MFDDLETDTAYQRALQPMAYFDSTPWEITKNPFALRMALNLKAGTQLRRLSPEMLAAVLGTAARLTNQTITADLLYLSGADDGKVDATIAGATSYFSIPRTADTAANFLLALEETQKSRPAFFTSVTPNSKFWIHSEYALPAGEQDWTAHCHTTITF
ncbi:TPA: hypothetical protein NIB68_005467 [Pseudomonas aeruginosa]|nr:hypothetical protein [Pseudomonas aeruginosa]